MIRVQKLSRPNKRSGFELAPGQTTEVKGLTLVNRNNFSVFVDKFSSKKKK